MYSTYLPSGETAREPDALLNATSPGSENAKRTGAAVRVGASLKWVTPRTVTAAASTPAAIHPAVTGRDREVRTTGESPDSSSSISIRASPIAWSRCLRSFFRHRSTSLRIGAGVSAGRAFQSGSSFRTEATVSETDVPRNALLPLSSS